jgi:PAS domain S-box-containing protein
VRTDSNTPKRNQPENNQPENRQVEINLQEEQLRQHQAHFRAALESSQTGIWEYDLGTGELLIDGAYGSFYGLTPGPHRLPANEISKFTSDHERVRNHKIFEQALEYGEAFEIEYLVNVPGLPERWLLSRGRPTSGPNGPLVLGTVVDITARKQAESAVHRSETRYRALVEATSQAIWTHPNQDSESTRWWQNLTGQTPEQASGLGWGDTLHPDDREHVLEAWAQSLVKNIKFDLEYRVRATDGSYRDLAVRGVPMLEADGQVREWIGTISDVTAARQEDRDAHFLLGLSELLRLSEHPETLLEKSSRAICEHIGGSRCTFLELEPELAHANVRSEFAQGSPSMIGRHELLRFGSVLEDLKAGRTVIVNDAEHDPRTAAAFESTYKHFGLSACVVIPLSRTVLSRAVLSRAVLSRVLRSEASSMRLIGQLSVGSKTPRFWSQSEIRLLETAAERVWNALERVRNEAELHRSEERFRTLAVATSNIVWNTNAAGELASPQKDWEEFTGQTEGEYLGRGWIESVHPDDRDEVIQSWQENLARKGTYYHEHRLRRADGEYRDLAVRGVPLLEPDGSVREWVGTMTDITERKQTARALETQALILREQADLLALVNETVIVRDPQDNVISWNRAAEKMYGFSRDESIGRVTHDLLETHFQIPETRESVRAILERDGVWEGELTHVRHDGSSIVVLSRQALQRKVLPNGQAGEPLAILEVNWDISERKRSEQILRESESRFRWLAEATPQMVCVSDTAGKLSYVNQAYSDYTGIKPMGENQDAARTGLLEVVHPEDRDSFMLENTQARKNGTTLRHELRIRSANTGQYRWFLHQLVPARDHAGEIIWWFGTSTDIHAHKEAELSLLKTLEQQKRFVSDASHEFRAPLTSILGNLGLLERYPNMPSEDRHEAITESTREAGRLGRLVSELLTLARSDAGVQPTLEDVNLSDVALEAWRDAHQFSNGCTLEQGEIETVEVEGNRDRLKQLALILLDNALKYTPSGGTVRLELRHIRTANGNLAELIVTDTGPGITPEDLPHVFERFYRADQSRTHGSDPGGSGLGLPIAQSIAQSHGGEISLENQTAGGIRAVVKLRAIERD